MRKRGDGPSVGHPGTLVVAIAVALAMAMAGCATGGVSVEDDTVETDDRVRVQVENHDWATVHVYALAGGQSASLGQLATNETSTFELPRTMTATGGEVRLVADPVGSADVHVTHRIQFEPGDTIVYSVEDQLELSSISVH